MALTITSARAISMCNDLVDSFDTDGTTGSLVVYAGTAPADADAAASNSILVTLDLEDPETFGAATDTGSAAVATLTGLPVVGTIAASGTATHFRMIADDDTVILQGTVGVTGSGADLILDTTALVQDATFQITSLTLSVPKQGA